MSLTLKDELKQITFKLYKDNVPIGKITLNDEGAEQVIECLKNHIKERVFNPYTDRIIGGISVGEEVPLVPNPRHEMWEKCKKDILSLLY